MHLNNGNHQINKNNSWGVSKELKFCLRRIFPLFALRCSLYIRKKLTLASRELILWGGLGLRGSRGASNFPSEIFRKAINFWWNFWSGSITPAVSEVLGSLVPPPPLIIPRYGHKLIFSFCIFVCLHFFAFTTILTGSVIRPDQYVMSSPASLQANLACTHQANQWLFSLKKPSENE